jgi:phosphatidate cytidylyltransferase
MAQPAPKLVGHELAARVGSAVVLAPVVLAAVYFGPPYFEVLLAVVAAILAWEWVRLCGADRAAAMAVLLTGIVFAAIALMTGGHGAGAYAGLALGALALAILARGAHRLWLALGVLYIGVPLVAFAWLRADPALGRVTAIWLLAVVWATDIGAYAFGRLIGGPKLAPRISPKKTWAGLIGGVACAMAAGAAAASVLAKEELVPFALLSGAVGLVSQIGDMAESGIKRHFQVKDMGTLIPGHGGLFDRVDGLLAAIVLVALLHWVGGRHVLAWS